MDAEGLGRRARWRATGIVRGVRAAAVPVEGGACSHEVGREVRWYTVGRVADDGASFEVLTGSGALVGYAVICADPGDAGCGLYFFSDDGTPSGRPKRWAYGGAYGAVRVAGYA